MKCIAEEEGTWQWFLSHETGNLELTFSKKLPFVFSLKSSVEFSHIISK